MLIAAENNKLKRKKVKFWEDEITSIVFGPLQIISAISAHCVLEVVLKIARDAGINENILPKSKAVNVIVKFWQKMLNNIEPDVVFCFDMLDDVTFNVMVEIKWGAPLTPSCELIRQWLNREPVGTTNNWIHIYLLPSEIRGQHDIQSSIDILRRGCEPQGMNCYNNCNGTKFNRPQDANEISLDWDSRLGTISWNKFHKIMTTTRSELVAINQWAQGVNYFLCNQGYIPFIGFTWLQEDQYFLIDNISDKFIFSKDPWFAFLSNDNFSPLSLLID